MQLTLEHVQGLAPDEKSIASARQLLSTRFWSNLGRSPQAAWGRCQGAAQYDVRIDLAQFGYRCSCPSRKLPCRHVLGLLLLLASSPDVIPTSGEPDWVRDWLNRRQASAEKQKVRGKQAPRPVNAQAQRKRAAQREDRIQAGLEPLKRWLEDLIRGGLASLESKDFRFWEEHAKRLVDAQAPGLANRVRSLGEVPGSSADWPQRLLDDLGRLALLIRAYERLADLDESLQWDVRQLIGWTVTQQELERTGEKLTDNWAILGQREEEQDRLRVQRSWMLGRNTGRFALVLQFAPGAQPFSESILPGLQQQGTLLFYPGAASHRARWGDRSETAVPISGPLPGAASAEELLNVYADHLARRPWLAALPGILKDVTLAGSGSAWRIRDSAGFGLPMISPQPWQLLALTGGRTCDIAGEWTGTAFRPWGLVCDGRYQMLP